MAQADLDLAQCMQRVQAWLGRGARTLLGIVGPPGAGKSTLAQQLQQWAPERSQIVPMDGFHLANQELQRLGRSGRKGAPDTFDSAGFVNLLQRLRQQGGERVVYAPDFRREIEEPIAGALPIFAHTQLLITEGNYLCLEQGGWAPVAALLDEIWYVQVDPDLRRQRLVARHIRFGRSAQAALDWVQSTDEPNARLIEAGRHRAHCIVHWE